MKREALLTAAYIQEIFLWYTMMSSRRRKQGLWDLEAEARCYGGDAQNVEDEGAGLPDGDLVLDEEDKAKVALSLPSTQKRLEHLHSTIRLMKECTFLTARYAGVS